ncbi:hypothetical protein FBU31_004551 [Coemansia sp. 'formosensis']|nr:hypothetical protein FBU31_004551 [Coemansia sp. 'formosensis']
MVPSTPIAPEVTDSDSVSRERKDKERAEIVALPQQYIERLVKSRPVQDPQAEWNRTYNKITKGQARCKAKKAVSDKAKVKFKRPADSSVPEEPMPKRTVTKRAALTKPVAKKPAAKRTVPDDSSPKEPPSKKAKPRKPVPKKD